MLQFAGKRLQVSASAHKACDTIETYSNRKVDDAVHLGVRCDGSGHGGCEAACMLYWKTAWLKPVDGPVPQRPSTNGQATNGQVSAPDSAVIERGTRAKGSSPDDPEIRYSCQATRLFEASSPLGKTDVRQYIRDLTSGNVTVWKMLWFMPLAVYNTIVGRSGHGRKFPSIKGLAGRATPTETLDLQPGELVEVKSSEEIMKTLNAEGSNRGMIFSTEMLPFCGKRYRVKQRVNQLVDETNGAMIKMKTPGIILEDVVCMSCYHPGYIFCPRGTYPYWREIWLKRVEETGAARATHV
jgi:hypothetical protein